MIDVDKLKRILACRNYIRTFPVYLCVKTSQQKHLIEKDIVRWNSIHNLDDGLFRSLNWYLTSCKQFRNLLQHRLKIRRAH